MGCFPRVIDAAKTRCRALLKFSIRGTLARFSQRGEMMRILLTGMLGAMMLAASLASAPAASTCTAWVDYGGNDDNTCVSFVKSRTSGHSPQVSGDTIYFWSG